MYRFEVLKNYDQSIFFLETAIHIEHIQGSTILAHNPQANKISTTTKAILANKNTDIGVYLNPDEISHVVEPEFPEQCKKYFEKNFEKLVEDEPLLVPWEIPGEYTEIERIMDRWCKETNELSRVNGLVLHSFSFTKCLEIYGTKEDILRDYLNIEKFSKVPICITYNPHQTKSSFINT